MRYSESHAYFQGKKKSNYVTFNCKKLERRSKQKLKYAIIKTITKMRTGILEKELKQNRKQSL